MDQFRKHLPADPRSHRVSTRRAEVCHPYSHLDQSLSVDSYDAADQHPSRRHSRDGDVGVERVTSRAERLSSDDVNAQAPADGHVEVTWEGRAPGMRLDLDVVADHRYAIETQVADSSQHRGPCPVLEDEAQAVVLCSQARQVGQTLGQVARKLWPGPRRWQRRGHIEPQLCAVDQLTRNGEGGIEPVDAFDLERHAQRGGVDGGLEGGWQRHISRARKISLQRVRAVADPPPPSPYLPPHCPPPHPSP